jgi:hypothetical protein
MSHKRFTSVALAIVVALSFAAVALAEDAPTITLVDPVKDFGTVPKGQVIDWSFEIKNTGTADLEIKSASPSCGCTVADFDKLIKPGQTGKVVAHVDTTNFSGPIAKSVTIQSNDPMTPTAQVTIHASVKPYVEAYPAGFLRYTILQGDVQKQSVVLYSEDETPFEIVEVKSPGDWVKVDYALVENEADRAPNGRKGQNQYKVDVTVGGNDARVGPLMDKILIKTNSKYQPEYRLSLSGVIRPTYIVAPSVVNFGEVASDGASEKIVTIQSNNRQAMADFRVSGVESNVQGIIAEAVATEQPGIFEVSIKIASTAKPGEFNGKLQIHTNDPIRPMAEIAVRGLVK